MAFISLYLPLSPFISLYLLISYIIYAKEKRMRMRIRFLSV